MSHVFGSHIVDILGVFGGVLGMSLAIYFQLIAQKDVHPGVVVAFFVTGLLMFAANTQPFPLQVETVLWLRSFAYAAFIMFELGMGAYVWVTADLKTPVEALTSAMEPEPERETESKR